MVSKIGLPGRSRRRQPPGCLTAAAGAAAGAAAHHRGRPSGPTSLGPASLGPASLGPALVPTRTSYPCRRCRRRPLAIGIAATIATAGGGLNGQRPQSRRLLAACVNSTLVRVRVLTLAAAAAPHPHEPSRRETRVVRVSSCAFAVSVRVLNPDTIACARVTVYHVIESCYHVLGRNAY